MKWEINLSEVTPFIILCVIVVSLSANSLGAFHLHTDTRGFNICFMVSEQQGGEPKSWLPPRGTELKAIPAVVGQPRDVLLEAAFPSRNPFPSTFGCTRAQVSWWQGPVLVTTPRGHILAVSCLAEEELCVLR